MILLFKERKVITGMILKKDFKNFISEKIIYNKDILLYFLLALSIFFNFIMIFRHENWRDEAQAWLIAKELNPIELFDVLSYEGHPCLWFLVLMPFAKLGFPYITLNIISFIFMSIAAVIFVRYSPFHKIATAMTVCSPMFVYFFAVIGRSYSLAALLIVILAWQYNNRYKHPFIYFSLVALLIQTHILIIGMAFAVCAVHFFEVLATAVKKHKYKLSKKKENSSFSNINIPKNFLALIIPLCSALFLLYEFRDVSNAQNSMANDNSFSVVYFAKCIYGFFRMFFFDDNLLVWFALIVLAVFAVTFTYILRFVRTIKYIFMGAMLFICPVYINVYVYSLKKYHVIMILLMIFWLIWIMAEELNSMTIYRNVNDEPRKEAGIDMCGILINAFSVILLFCIIINYCGDITFDYFNSYSDAKNTAVFIDSLTKDSVVFEYAEDYCNAVVPYLRKNTIRNPFTDGDYLYCERNKNKIKMLDYDEFLSDVRADLPNLDYVYLLYGKSVVRGFRRIENVPDNLEIVYETQDTDTVQEQFIVYRIPL